MNRFFSGMLFLIGLVIIFITTGCVLDTIDPENGIYWETTLADTLTAGLSYNELEGLILVGDQSGNLYAIQDGSGFEKWKRSFSNEIITGVYAGADYVFCLSLESNLNQSRIRRFTLNDGILEWSTNLSTNVGRFFLVDDYATGSSRILIPTGSNILAWYPSDNHLVSYDYSSESQNLKAVIDYGNSGSSSRAYYAVDAYGSVLELNSSLGFVQASAAASTTIFTRSLTIGSTSGNGDFLFVGTTSGIKMFQIPALTLQATAQSDSILASGMVWDVTQEKLFALLSKYPRSGLGCYDPSQSLQEQWFSETTGDITHSPLALSLSYNLLVYLDDYGSLTIVDSQASTLISQTYFGTMDVDGLTFAKNALETKLYIPLSTPSKVVAYSLSHVVQSQSSSSAGF